MIVRSQDDVRKADLHVDWGNGTSSRFLTTNDEMGFTLTDTLVNAGTTSLLEYKNHLEACYCFSGEGEVQDIATGKVYPIKPGTMYALNKHDRHYLTAKTDLRLVSVFNPPLKGHERHNLKAGGSSSY